FEEQYAGTPFEASLNVPARGPPATGHGRSGWARLDGRVWMGASGSGRVWIRSRYGRDTVARIPQRIRRALPHPRLTNPPPSTLHPPPSNPPTLHSPLSTLPPRPAAHVRNGFSNQLPQHTFIDVCQVL